MSSSASLDELQLNFKLDHFFTARDLRTIILRDVALQPDHFLFNKDDAARTISEFATIEPLFCKTYTTFIDIFDQIRSALEHCRLSPSQVDEIRSAAIEFALRDGFTVFSEQSVYLLGVNDRPVTVSAVSIQNHRSFLGSDGNAYSGDDVLEAVFDTLKAILDYCGYLATQKNPSTSTTVDLPYLFKLFNQFRIYKSDWYDCLLLGNDTESSLSELANNAVQVGRPIGLLREFSLRMQHLSFGGARSIAVATHAFTDSRLKASRKIYRDFRKFRDSMLDHIAYPFLNKLVNELDIESADARIIELYLFLSFVSLGNIRKFGSDSPRGSYIFECELFLSFLAEFLDLPLQLIEELTKRLEYRSGQKEDIWFTPLVRVDTKYVLLSPMCAQANFERFVERVIGRSHDINTGRGFENYVFELTTEAVRKARLPFKVQRPFKARGAASAFEEIDLLILADHFLFVGEVKYDAFPADEFSVLQHAFKMKSACEQAQTKATFVKQNWQTIADSIGWPTDINQVVPFALTEKLFLNGLSFHEVPIICVRDFEDFFGGEVRFNLVLNKDGIASGGTTVRTFTNIASASKDFQGYLNEPVRRASFARMIKDRILTRPKTPDVAREYWKREFEISETT